MNVSAGRGWAARKLELDGWVKTGSAHLLVGAASACRERLRYVLHVGTRTSGELIGLFDFEFDEQKNKGDWLRVRFGIEEAFGPMGLLLHQRPFYILSKFTQYMKMTF